jgi:hypothetical protein
MRVRSLVLPLVALFAAIPMVASATSIVGIWRKNRISISADSKQTLLDRNMVPVGSRQSCKIYEVRGLIFALAGLAEAERINVIEDIKNSKELTDQGTGGKLQETSLVVGAESAVVKVLKARRSASDPDVVVQLLIAGKIDGKLQMVKSEFRGVTIQGEYSLPNLSHRVAYPQDRGHDDTNPNRGVELLGMYEPAERFQKLLPEWNLGDDVAVSRRLVAVETADTKDSQAVGPPIATIVVTKRGARWINKGVCNWDPAKPGK